MIFTTILLNSHDIQCYFDHILQVLAVWNSSNMKCVAAVEKPAIDSKSAAFVDHPVLWCYCSSETLTDGCNFFLPCVWYILTIYHSGESDSVFSLAWTLTSCSWNWLFLMEEHIWEQVIVYWTPYVTLSSSRLLYLSVVLFHFQSSKKVFVIKAYQCTS